MNPLTCDAARRIALAGILLSGAVQSLSALDLYWGGGSTDITDGTPLPITAAGLTGTWNGTTKNWATDPAGTTYTTYADGVSLHLGGFWDLSPTSAVLTNALDVQLTALAYSLSGITNANTWNRYFDLTAASPRTLTPVGDRCVIRGVSHDGTRGARLLANVFLTGSVPIEKYGSASFEVQSNSSSYTGTATIRQGALTVSNTGSLKGVPQFNVRGRVVGATMSGYGANDFSTGALYISTASGANDKLSDTGLIVLDRGNLDHRESSVTTTETTGRVDLQTWGILGAGQGNVGGTLILSDATAGLTRGTTGLGMAIVPVNAAGLPFTRVQVPNGLTSGTLLPWLASSRANFLYANAADSHTLTAIAPTAPDTNVGNWPALYGASSDLRVGDSTAVVLTGSLGSDLTIRSLGFYNTSSSTIALGDATTLTIDAGGIAMQAAGSNGKVQLITNGTVRAGTSTLYLHTGTVNPGSRLELASVVAGESLSVVKAGVEPARFSGPSNNTYGGDTIVFCGPLNLAKSGGAIAIPGGLTIHRGGSVNVDADGNQIATNATVTILEDGLLYSRSQVYGGVVTIQGGTLLFANSSPTMSKAGTGLVFNGGWLIQSSSVTGTLNLQTDVRYEDTATMQARFERLGAGAYVIELDGANRTFDVADSSTLAADTPEMVVDAAILPGSPAGGSLTKTGLGTLQLTGTNTYAGGTAVNGGTLHVATLSAPAQSGLAASTGSAAQNTYSVTFFAPVAKDMVVGQTLTGTTIPAGRTIVRVVDDYEVFTSSANIIGISTNLAVNALSRSGSLGSGAVSVNNADSLLQVDPGIALTNAITVNAGAKLAASGATLKTVVLNSGALVVDLGKGVLTSTDAVTLNGTPSIEISGTVPEEPVVVLSASSVTGTFATWTEGYKVTYTPTQVLVGPAAPSGMVILVR